MPVNFVQVKQNLKRYSVKVKQSQDQLDQLAEEFWQAFVHSEQDIDHIREFVGQALAQNSKIVCACPVNEPLTAHFPVPKSRSSYTIMAADGSQITPSHHKAIQFCIINVGLIKAHIGSGKTPDIFTYSHFLEYEDLYSPEGSLVDEDTVALRRDHAERAALLEHISVDHTPIVTLTDGPLGIYHRKDDNSEYQRWQKQILDMYVRLEEQGVITAGYIDKPGGDLIGRLFSLLRLPKEEIKGFDLKNRYYKGISDAALLTRVLKQPGERSAIFEVANGADQKSEISFPVCFFYLNIGQQFPYLVRVEFPKRVVENPDRINLLHAAVYNEVQVLETHPYPYILHRAHELAVIHFDEHSEVERLVLEAFEEAGVRIGVRSNKEANKILSSKK